MDEQIYLLRAEIAADLQTIKEAYEYLDNLGQEVKSPERNIVIGYYLHVLYGLFENLFSRIAEKFGNHVTDEARWHAELLKRMTLDVMPVRPKVISQESYACLNELRTFRHLFRNAYLLQFDPDRLNLVLQKAITLKSIYEADITAFLDFLDDLVKTDS